MNSLPKTVTRQRRGCDLNAGPSAPESSTLTTRLPSHPPKRKKVTNDKLHGSVATHLRCGGVVNNQIKKCLLRVQHSNHSATELPGKRKNRLDDTNRKASRFSSCPMLDGCVTVGDQTESAGLHGKRVGAEPG